MIYDTNRYGTVEWCPLKEEVPIMRFYQTFMYAIYILVCSYLLRKERINQVEIIIKSIYILLQRTNHVYVLLQLQIFHAIKKMHFKQ